MHNLSKLIEAIRREDDEEAEAACRKLKAEAATSLMKMAIGEAGAHPPDVDRQEARWWAIRGLALCGDERAVPLLVAALGDANAEVRAAAALAIAEIAQRRPQAENAHLSSGMKAIARLLNDEQGFVRQAAADALVRFGDEALPLLEAILANAPESARTRAAYALRKIGTVACAPLLFQILNDENYLVHIYAREALDELGLFDNVLVTV